MIRYIIVVMKIRTIRCSNAKILCPKPDCVGIHTMMMLITAKIIMDKISFLLCLTKLMLASMKIKKVISFKRRLPRLGKNDTRKTWSMVAASRYKYRCLYKCLAVLVLNSIICFFQLYQK